eukprot:6076660-Pleurochrysis_carterae.AAC.1
MEQPVCILADANMPLHIARKGVRPLLRGETAKCVVFDCDPVCFRGHTDTQRRAVRLQRA